MSFSDIAFTKISWRKAEIHHLLKGFNRILIRETIINIVAKESNISTEEAKNLKTLRPSIVKIILKEFE